jgi:polyisoprenoid-binding protein YceI
MRNALLTLVVLLSASSVFAADEYAIDPVHSMVQFRVKHLGVSYTLGRFNNPTGKMHIDEANPKKSSIEVSVKVADVDTNDAKRDAHIKGPDFFNGKMFPKITFKSTSVKKTGDTEFEVTGDMTLHGVTKTITVKAEKVGAGKDPWGGYRTGYYLKLTLKRSDYKMNFMQGPSGIGDEIRLEISIEGIRSKK